MNPLPGNSENLETRDPGLTSAQAGMGESDAPSEQPKTLRVPQRFPDWNAAAGFFLSALFYCTAVCAVLAPFPLLLMYFRKGRKAALVASVTNAGFVYFVGGKASLIPYSILVLALTWICAEMLERRKSIEKVACASLAGMAGLALAVLLVYWKGFHLDPVMELHSQIMDLTARAGKPLVPDSKFLNPSDLDEWKHSFLVEFVPAVLMSSLVMVWANLMLLLRVNPKGIRERIGLDAGFMKKWKTPELLVWPTLLAGFFVVVDFGLASDIGLIVFEFLMAIYAIQGLSILSDVFDLWGVRGMFRVLGYSLSLLVMLPLIFSLGFFDLWFDFRGKLRQS